MDIPVEALPPLLVHVHLRRVQLRPTYVTLYREGTTIKATVANKRQ